MSVIQVNEKSLWPLKAVQHVMPGGGKTVESFINPWSVLWIEPSREGDIGQCHVTLLGGVNKAQLAGRMSLANSFDETVDLLLSEQNRIAVVRHDRTGRKQFETVAVVSLDHVRSVYANLNKFWTIEFNDCSTLDVKLILNRPSIPAPVSLAA